MNGPGEAPEYIIHYVVNNLCRKVVTRMDVHLTDYSSRNPILKKGKQNSRPKSTSRSYFKKSDYK